MNTQLIKSKFVTAKTFWLLLGILFVSIFLRDFPVLNWFFAPFNQFEVLLHEASHAIACVFTGGSVSGLTIVEDGNGHGGLTFTHGGIPFIYSQAGYIGETLWGCFLIAVARFPNLSRTALVLFGIGVGLVSLVFMSGALFAPGMFLQAAGSIVWGVAISALLVWIGMKFSDKWAHAILLFIAVQSCLSSLQGVWVLFLQSLGFFPGTWSDATNMQRLTGIPAAFWGIGWSLFSIFMLGLMLYWSFKADHAAGAQSKNGDKIKLSIDPAQQVKKINAQADIEAELSHLHQTLDAGQKINIKKEERHRK